MKIQIGGDICVTEESLVYFKNGDGRAAFTNVCDKFKKADRVIVNLECALTEHDKGIKKMGPCLKGPKMTAKALKDAGVTECALSNNHTFDFGLKGLSDTTEALDSYGINWFGIGENYEDSRKNYIIEQDGMKIAVINVCEHEYSYATETRKGARPFDEFETMYDIREAKKIADHIIVIYHGGKEHCRYPSPRLLKACREMVRCGAGVVLCQHSHCIGCYEEFEGGHILYGQGNFHFVKSVTTMYKEGLLVELDIEKNKIGIEFFPVLGENGAIYLAEPENVKNIIDEMLERSKTLETGEWKNHWHDYCKSVEPAYRIYMSGYTQEDDEDKTQNFSHRLDCEAHLDVWRELFPTWNMTNETE